MGGDFFDWYLIDGGLAFTLGDVMGKGAGAGMIAATTRAVIGSAKNSHDPVAALTLTADCFATDLGQASSFATLFHARLRAEDGRVLFSDAGHGLTILIRPNRTWKRLSSRGPDAGHALGIPRTHPQSRRHARQLQRRSPGPLRRNTRLDQQGRPTGLSAQDSVDTITAKPTRNNNPDDVTVLAIRRHPTGV